jgi:hypothetical protein|tara:strand:- start:35 stop:226 length:192 start_codon:yes stop_codon:yes gene_type:complete
MRYKVRCYEKNIWELEVEADSEEEAEMKAEKHYDEFGFEHYKGGRPASEFLLDQRSLTFLGDQ